MTLIDDLLALAASKTVDLQKPPKPVLLQPIMQQVVDRLTYEAESKQIALTYDAPPEMLAALTTEEGLARVLDNLIDNAIKYTPSGGQVDVRLEEQPAGAVISVSDTGIGIPQEALSRLGEEFFRARNARRSGIVGTGLGLSIVKQLVEHFGGLLSIHSVEGEGTTFKLALQMADTDDETEGASHPENRATSRPSVGNVIIQEGKQGT